MSLEDFTGSDTAVLAALGSRIARERLRRNLTQEFLADEAGVSIATLRRLEAGRSTQATNLVRVLRALELLPRLAELFADPPVHPLEDLERGGRRRRRAASPRPAPSEPPKPWTWGEDR